MESWNILSFCLWLISLSILFLRVPMLWYVSELQFFLWLNNTPSVVHTTFCCVFVGGHWVVFTFGLLWIMLHLMDISVPACDSVSVFNSSVYIPGSTNAGSYGWQQFWHGTVHPRKSHPPKKGAIVKYYNSYIRFSKPYSIWVIRNKRRKIEKLS